MNPFTILINGRNTAGAAFESAEMGMQRLNKRAGQLKQLFVSGVVVTMLRKISGAIMDCTTRGDELAASGEKAKSAWRDVGSVIADGMAGAIKWLNGASAATAENTREIIDDMRRGAAYLAGRSAGLTPEEAKAGAAGSVEDLNDEAKQRRWKTDKGVQDLEKKTSEYRDKNSTATERLAAATAKLAEEEQKLAGLGQYDLARVPVLNSILELQGKIAAAMKDQAAEAEKVRAAEIALEQERVNEAARDVKLNKAALAVEQGGIRKGFGQRRDERQKQKELDREAAKAANREEVALKQAARDPTRRYRQQLQQQLGRAGMGIGDAGALLNQGEDSNIPRARAGGIPDRYARLLGAKESVADSEKILGQVEREAAKRIGEINKGAESDGAKLDNIRTYTKKMSEVLDAAMKPA